MSVSQSVQLLSCVWLFATPWITACQASRSITNSQSLPKLMPWVSDAIQPSHPLSSPSPPALNLSQHRGLFKWVSSSHQVAKVLEFQFQHQEYVRVFQSPYDHLTPKLTFSAYSFSYSVKTFVNVLHPPLASSEVFITRSNNDRLDWGLQGTANNQIMNFVWEWSSGKKKKKRLPAPFLLPLVTRNITCYFSKLLHI